MRNPTDTEVHPLVASRWSPRAFAETPVDPDALRRCLEAARWAPSCFNDQPWRFVVADRADDPEGHAALAALLNDWNRAWAAKAPVLLLVAATSTFAKNGKPNAHARYDAGGAVAWLSAQATAEGLSLHQMAGFSAERALALGLPEGIDPIAMVALGHEGDPDSLPEDLAASERRVRERQPLDAMVWRPAQLG